MVISLISMVTGIVLMIWTPSRNNQIGYKSPLALKNDYTWKVANKFFAKMLIFSGGISLVFYFITNMIINVDSSFLDTFVIAITVIFMFVSIVVTEIYLITTFDKNGKVRVRK